MERSKSLWSNGDSSNNSTYQDIQTQVAPFVSKIYQMVNDPKSDLLISWGGENNSFLVLDPCDFSLLLLPLYFKHANFSSFVRQLNTYGFRKIDPDKWEFAHESFLRCQAQLLPLIIRRNNKKNQEEIKRQHVEEAYDEESNEMLIKEVARLRKEQKMLEEEVQGLNRRLKITEESPHKMLSFLIKVAEDPEMLPRLILSKKRQIFDEKEKKRRLSRGIVIHNGYSPGPLPQCFEGDHDVRPVVYAIPDDDLAINEIGFETPVVLLPEFGGTEGKNVAYPFSLLGHVFF